MYNLPPLFKTLSQYEIHCGFIQGIALKFGLFMGQISKQLQSALCDIQGKSVGFPLKDAFVPFGRYRPVFVSKAYFRAFPPCNRLCIAEEAGTVRSKMRSFG